jgi:hypothetical protein
MVVPDSCYFGLRRWTAALVGGDGVGSAGVLFFIFHPRVDDRWFVLREKYCWLVADKPSEQGGVP